MDKFDRVMLFVTVFLVGLWVGLVLPQKPSGQAAKPELRLACEQVEVDGKVRLLCE